MTWWRLRFRRSLFSRAKPYKSDVRTNEQPFNTSVMTSPSVSSLFALPPAEYAAKISKVREQLQNSNLPQTGLHDTESHLQDIVQLVPRATAPNYFGFVTGGVLPITAHADHLVTDLDANVAVHLPDVSIATDIEDTTLRWLLQMFNFDPAEWTHRILTTGATASNVLGLACGRDWAVREAARKRGLHDVSVAKLGLANALRDIGKRGIRILTTQPHSSLIKAASIVGLGRQAVCNVVRAESSVSFDLVRLEQMLTEEEYLNIVGISCGEINTGRFATTGSDVVTIYDICQKYGAWIHVDAGRYFNTSVLSRSVLLRVCFSSMKPLPVNNGRDVYASETTK
jgi:glutamate/tyrosine decarboxylase-like PLP-dependent enzyme